MGNRMSQYGSEGYGELDYDENAQEQLDYENRVLEPYDPKMPRLRGGDASNYSNARMDRNGKSVATSQRAGYGRHSPTGTKDAGEDDFYEVPATDFYAAQCLRRGHRQASPVAARRAANGGGHFDFNDAQQPNPWHHAESQRRQAPKPDHVRSPEFEPGLDVEVSLSVPGLTDIDCFEVRHFAQCYDKDLRAYLAARSISFGFLAEIDQFLKGHPEIATCDEGRSTLRQITVLPPLQAYKYFLKGYTRPAR
jgi:hypothetical protein